MFTLRAAVILSIAIFAAATSANAQSTQKRLIGDYGFWSRTQTPPYGASQIPFSELTEVNHAGVSFTVDGSLAVPDGFLEPELIAKAHQSGVKVVLLLGGDFPALAANPQLISVLTDNVRTFVTQNGYDGVDIDWEYPVGQEGSTFVALLSALRAMFPAPTYVLSADVAPWGGSGYAFGSSTSIVDFFNIMTYDCAGPWTDDAQLNSPVFRDPNNPQPYECEPGGSVKEAIDLYVGQNGIPPEKLNIGTPFYGYYYQNTTKLYGLCDHCSGTVISESYGTFIKPRVNALGWQRFVDPNAMVPYLLRTDGEPGFITYDDFFSTYLRVQYSIWQRGLGGSFLWSLDADYDGRSQDLLAAMAQATAAGGK